MNNTKIEWCTRTLNPVVGCTYGCPYCYARRMNNRFGYVKDFAKPQFFPERLKQLEGKKPQIIFMDSMSDISDWGPEWIEQTFKAIEDNPQHIYLFLTKRPYIYSEIFDSSLSNNIWIGTTVTNIADTCEKIAELKELSEHYEINTYLSIEPLLEEIPASSFLENIRWVIIGAETGHRKNKVVPQKEWIDNIVSDCKAFQIPVFMKESLLPIMGEENMLRQFPESFKRSE